MSRTIEAIMRHMAPPPRSAVVPLRNTRLAAEWQDGPATDLGFRQQKLRLSFVRRHKPTPNMQEVSGADNIALELATSH